MNNLVYLSNNKDNIDIIDNLILSYKPFICKDYPCSCTKVLIIDTNSNYAYCGITSYCDNPSEDILNTNKKKESIINSFIYNSHKLVPHLDCLYNTYSLFIPKFKIMIDNKIYSCNSYIIIGKQKYYKIN